MRRLYSLFATLALLFIFIIAPAVAVQAQGLPGCNDTDPSTPCNVFDESCKNAPDSVLCQEAKKDATVDDNSLFGPDGIITKVTQLVSFVVGIAAVIMIIIGGIQYVTSSGDSTNITNAKNTILYAIIGLVVALIARAIVSFLLVRI